VIARFAVNFIGAGAILLFASACLAQTPADSAAALRQNADKKSADWETLAKALDNKIQRVPPCDARVKQSIDEVRIASEARLAALTEVLRNAIIQAAADIQRVKDALATEEGNLRETSAERADTDQERIAVNAEASDLRDAAKLRAGFDDAVKKIGEISDRTDARADNAGRQVEARTLFSVALRDLLAADQKRLDALEREQVALAAEGVTWSQYYAARAARADTECSITGAGRSSGRKKQ